MAENNLTTYLATTAGAVVFVYFIYVSIVRRPGKIPGPLFTWPVIGHLLTLLPSKLHSNMNYFTKRYGPIFTLKLGSLEAVIISDYNLLRKAFRMPELSYRPDMFIFEFASQGYHGLLSSSGDLWNEHRRFSLRHLRDLGMGKTSIEIHIQREALQMVDVLEKSKGQPFDINNSLNIAITNIVWAIVAGRRMEYDDPKFLGFMAAIRRNMEEGLSAGIVGFLPWLRNILPKSFTKIDLIQESIDTTYNYFKDIILAHRSAFDDNDLRDFTDHYLAEQMRQGEASTFSDLQLTVSMGDLFVAGGETTATTLRWGILLLAHYPEIQIKLQNEIDSVLGKERRPTLGDREMMPYTDAVIHEIQRFADIAPLGVPHTCNVDVIFEGYKIPKGAMVVGFLGGFHRSEKYWAKPEEFYPEHFLDENGSFRNNVEGFLPFSTGKRQCIGENLARAELFIFLVYFFQTFNFSLSQSPKPSLLGHPQGGFVRWPSPFRVIVETR